MRRTLLSTVILLSALALTGCSTGGVSLSSPEDMSSPEVVPGPQGADMAVPGAPSLRDETSADADRQVIVTGYVTLTVEEPAEAAADAVHIVEKAGGRIDSRSESAPTDGDEGRAQLTVRIPSDKLTETLDALKALGEVEEVQLDEQDVTSQARDLDARITALRTSVDRLITLMASADTTADLISIESALSERQANLESMESQKRSLDDQVAMTTITLYLGSEADAPVDEPDTFLSGLQTGWDVFVGFFSFLLVAFGVLLPWLVLVPVLLFGILYAVRWRSKAKPQDS